MSLVGYDGLTLGVSTLASFPSVISKSTLRWCCHSSTQCVPKIEFVALRSTESAPRPFRPRRTGAEVAREGEHCSQVCVPLSSGTFIRKLRILNGVEFIEAPTFTAIVAGYLNKDATPT